jgi:hypothetical protein
MAILARQDLLVGETLHALLFVAQGINHMRQQLSRLNRGRSSLESCIFVDPLQVSF